MKPELYIFINEYDINNIIKVKYKMHDDALKYGVGFVIRKKRYWFNPLKYINNYKFVNINPGDVIMHHRKSK